MAIVDMVGGVEFRAWSEDGVRYHTINGSHCTRDAWASAWHEARQADAATILVIDGVRYDGMPAREKWMALLDAPWRLTLRCPHSIHIVLDPSAFDDGPPRLIEYLLDRYRHRCPDCGRMPLLPALALGFLIARARRYPEVAVYRSPEELHALSDAG